MSVITRVRKWFAPVEKKDGDFEAVLRMLSGMAVTSSNISVTPENCQRSPTVNAIVTAVSRRIATLPVQVLEKTEGKGRDGRTRKEALPDHPVSRLLRRPNSWQDRVSFWTDAASRLVRYGNFVAYKSRGMTGPIRELVPIDPNAVKINIDPSTLLPEYRVVYPNGEYQILTKDKLVHARGPSRDTYWGDSPVLDAREDIALEIAATEFGASFFGNGAMPFMIFRYAQGFAGFKTKEEEAEFKKSFQETFSAKGRFKAMLLPKGIEKDKEVELRNDANQFTDTRRLQREIIAGAFGIPAYAVGSLERSTYNNVEQMSIEMVTSVVLPYVRMFEAALEDSLLTDEDRRAGRIIRFNLDGALRGDFKGRQEGLKIMREWGIISANDWREMENMNPITEDDGGEDYIRPMNMAVAGEPMEDPNAPGEQPSNDTPASGSDDTEDEGM